LPCSFSRDSFGTNRDDQRELWGEILEGDLPIDALNTKLAEIKLQLPPNIPAGAQVIVHFTVDDNFVLTAELEVPSVNRKGKVIVDLKSATAQVHVFQQLEDLLTRLGDRLRPEERAALQQSRVALEDLSEGFRRSKEADDSDGMWNSHNRMVAEAKRLQDKMADVRRRLA
jgi:molecular chaperone DnaK (HSP70)